MAVISIWMLSAIPVNRYPCLSATSLSQSSSEPAALDGARIAAYCLTLWLALDDLLHS
jgi:hypothetical protein